MAVKIIIESDDDRQVEITLDPEQYDDREWEEVCYEIGCSVSRELAIRWLGDIEERLFCARDANLRPECFRKRTRITRFGSFPVWRRLYKDSQGESHFLLDEYLNWIPYRRATPSLREALVELSTKATFREVDKTLEKLTAGVLSTSTIHRALQEVAEAAIDGEKQECEACFQEGRHPPPGEGRTPILYTEADGLWVHLQREGEQKHYELKNAIAYEGWECISGEAERYRLVNKKIYCHGDDDMPFWDGAGLALHKWWELGDVKLIVLGGDDAGWIDKGVDELGFCIRQLSGFHLARSCKRGWENGDDMYAAIRSGRVRQTLGEVKERDGKTAQKARRYVLKRLDKGIDWREKVEEILSVSPDAEILDILDEARGLGAIEGNQGNVFADRMKDRGMSWTIKGAQHMGKVTQLSFNGELGNWCGGKPLSGISNDTLSFALFDQLDGRGNRTALPATEGPHASRPWVRTLRSLAEPDYRLN